jgi:hypothetical protein
MFVGRLRTRVLSIGFQTRSSKSGTSELLSLLRDLEGEIISSTIGSLTKSSDQFDRMGLPLALTYHSRR